MFYLEDFFYHVASKSPRPYQSGGIVSELAKTIISMNGGQYKNLFNPSFLADK